ncbi:hypothetical protein BFP72_05310 [Reichenbachiella sp. 5M10]|nr:hypothetical protein BFP72_05310 [Reichenbachiella sp. 5M10]
MIERSFHFLGLNVKFATRTLSLEMNRSKKIFLLIVLLFLIILIFFVVDFAKRTTFRRHTGMVSTTQTMNL